MSDKLPDSSSNSPVESAAQPEVTSQAPAQQAPGAAVTTENNQSGTSPRRRRRGGGRRHRGKGPQSQTENDVAPDSASQNTEPSLSSSDTSTGQPIPAAAKKIELPEAFAKLGVETPILHALAHIHFVTPSEIQEKLIPVALTGRDVIGQARTGTGKTAAFGMPILQKLNPDQPFQALVVVPTRELAVQVEAELVRFARHKPLRLGLAYGGTKISGQIKAMARQPHVVVGTPGRILDLVERQVLPLANMKFVVCDEVDRMFDIGFRDDIRRILAECTSEHQTIFVSATINDDIERMVARHMRDPERIFTSSPDEQLTNPEARQFYIGVEPWDKQRALRMMIKAEHPHLAIIFCRTKRAVDKVAAGLQQDGVNASPIHGDLMQNKRERVMRGFRTGKINVLVATDLASRGIDVHEVTHVINYDIPEDPEAYVHRVGRTARMGATGMSVTFVSRGQAQLQTEIEKLTNHLMEEYKIPGFEPRAEPNPRAGGAPGSAAPVVAPAATTENNAVSADASSPQPAAAQSQPDGYMPTGFGHVKLEQSFRPISGRFKVKHRR